MLDEDRWIEYPDDQAFTGASEPLPPFGSSEYAMVMEAQLFRPLLPSPLSELLPENPGPSTNGADELLRQRYDEEREARVRLEREREHERGLFLAQQEQLRKLLESSSSSSSCSISISNNPDVISVASSEVTLLHEVGRGAFGQVFKARLRGKEVAVKQPLRQTAHPEVIAQFRAEMAVMVALHHPNLILLMGACFEPQRLFFVTEFAANGSLCDALFQRKVALPFPRKMAILKDVAQGMNWLHSLRPPLVHRDLKTGNVLLDDQWRAKVSDFGLSAIRSLDPDGNPLSAPDQQRVGSPFFMAPETLRTPPHTSPQSDLYSFAIVIWELLSEAPVYEGLFHSYEEVVESIAIDGYRPDVAAMKSCPPRLCQFVQQAWHHHPSERTSFAHAIECAVFDHGLIDGVFGAAAQDQPATFWRSCFLDERVVSWPRLIQQLATYLRREIPPTSHPAALLRQGLVKVSDLGVEEVSVTDFARFFLATSFASLGLS